VALLAGLGVVAEGAADRQRAALPSRLATETLLLDAAWVGDRLVAVGEWGHVLLSDDGGEDWRQARLVPTQATLTAVAFANAREGWAVGHDAVVLHTADAGETWEIQYAAPEEEAALLGVWFGDAERGLAVGAFGMMLETRDGGETWARRRMSHGEHPDDRHLNDVFPGPNGSLFVPAEGGTVLRSRDAGASWERLHLPYEGSFWGGIALEEDAVVVFGMRGNLFRSDDLGETWHALPTGTDQSLQGATRLRDGALVVVGLGGVVLVGTKGGTSFTTATRPDRRGIAAVAEGTGKGLLLFGERGVQRVETDEVRLPSARSGACRRCRSGGSEPGILAPSRRHPS
jgi:photosystem II stability/assembly factor-like uncharacterized protein